MSEPTKLWRVTLEYELVVVAHDERDAESEAAYYVHEDGAGEPVTMASEITRATELPKEWAQSIPFGGDKSDERSCVERLQSSTAAAVAIHDDRNPAPANSTAPAAADSICPVPVLDEPYHIEDACKRLNRMADGEVQKSIAMSSGTAFAAGQFISSPAHVAQGDPANGGLFGSPPLEIAGEGISFPENTPASQRDSLSQEPAPAIADGGVISAAARSRG